MSVHVAGDENAPTSGAPTYEVPTHEILVIGAGFSGIGVGIKLLKEGFSDFLIVDEAQGVEPGTGIPTRGLQ